MDLPDESQWDETTCNVPVCQHPQCWEAIRRIERGNPRILGSCKPLLNTEGLRCMKDLPDKSLIDSTDGPPKLSVLNLNETQLPCSQDIRNMVVMWIPEKPEERLRSPAEMTPIVTSQDGEEKRKKSAMKNKSTLDPSGKQHTGRHLKTQEVAVPPPSPVYLFEQLNSENVPSLAQFDMLPPDLLKDLLPDGQKAMYCPEMKTQLPMMKKYLPLEKSQPGSVISTKTFLSIHRLTLQRPGLRYPEHLRKLHYNLKTKGPRKQQQQQKRVKTPIKKQEVKKKAKSDLGGQNPVHKSSVAVICDTLSEDNVDSLEVAQEGESHSGNRTLPNQENDAKQKQQMEMKGPTPKQNAMEGPKMDYPENYLDSSGSELARTEPTKEDISAQVEDVLAASQEKTTKDLPASKARTHQNLELKLLSLLQATEDEVTEKQLFLVQGENF